MDQETNPNLLQDVEQEIYLVPASKGLRFLNYLIDVLVFYALFFGSAIVWAAILYSSGDDPQDSMLAQRTGSAILIQYLFSFAILISYYTIFEATTKGRTIGKFITGTKAVREDGSNLSWKDAFLRTLCRLIPFEPFSALGGALWHDSITKTLVIKKAN